MKKLIASLIGVSTLIACGDKNEDNPPVSLVPSVVTEAFQAKYPNASNVMWDINNTYYIASFTNTKADNTSSAWFVESGEWCMTDNASDEDSVPTAVKDAFTSSKYSEGTIDEVDEVERNDAETLYVIEVEMSNGAEIDLYYTADGTLVKEIYEPNDDDDDYDDLITNNLPDAISSKINELYPNATIIEVDNDDNETEVEILDGKFKRELQFNSSNEWLQTETEMDYTDLPSNISSAIAESEYASYKADDDVEHIVTPTSEYYIVELDSDNDDVDLMIKADGTISIYNDDTDDDDSDTDGIPSSVVEYIETNYAGAIIEDNEIEDGNLIVEFKHDNKDKEAEFSANGQWIKTYYSIKLNDLPQAIKDQVQEHLSAPDTELEDIYYVTNSEGNKYVVHIEKDDEDEDEDMVLEFEA